MRTVVRYFFLSGTTCVEVCESGFFLFVKLLGKFKMLFNFEKKYRGVESCARSLNKTKKH